jgi:hypothetical protein
MDEEQKTDEVEELEKESFNQKESTLLSWEANEYHPYEHGWKWYLALVVASLAVIGFSIYTKDWFVIAIALILDIFIILYTRKKPENMEYRITQLGIYAGEHFYPYGGIHSFWLSLHDRERKLNIIFMKKYLPQLTILIDNADPLQVKTIMGKYIPEQENRTDSLIDILSRLLKLQ